MFEVETVSNGKRMDVRGDESSRPEGVVGLGEEEVVRSRVLPHAPLVVALDENVEHSLGTITFTLSMAFFLCRG